ncbi:MAG: hypothetical protein LAP39_03975 [Acidobacteriia bacterium]|nr:hypothetical protein [Terriglobia bacterium]
MAAKKKAAGPKPPRTRKERKFPALTFAEALALAEGIQKYAAGQKVRRLTLFEKLNKEPDSFESRRLVTASGQYGLTKGSYQAEFLELTPEGNEATSDDIPPAKKLTARFNLAIKRHAPFDFLYEKIKGNKVPAKEVMADYLSEANVKDDEKAECIDTFILNAKSLGLLRTIGGSERLVPIEQVIEEAPQSAQKQTEESSGLTSVLPPISQVSIGDAVQPAEDFSKICFYITPIGKEDSEERRHADFLMEYIIKPAVKEFDLTVVRADQMGKPGMIGKQVIEHILKARLVIADLSFHNPNVFYELCLRHATRLPTVQVKREVDNIPFDVNQYRTIPIETRDPYTLVPKLQTYTAQVANQVRRALEDSESGDNPISLYYPSAKLSWDDK